MRVGSLFTGIGGIDLGLERAGMEIAWQVECDDYCRRVLARHWPGVRRWDDVRTFPPDDGEWAVDLIAGGFPCTDISSSGLCRGIDGPQSGLWSEMVRVVGLLQPRFVIVENVADLLHRGMERVLGDLAALGFDAEWECLPAACFGLPQRRDRLFIVAHRAGSRLEADVQPDSGPEAFESIWQEGWDYADGLAQAQYATAEAAGRVRGMDDGVPARVDRVRALGNAVVPQVAEAIGRCIMRLL